MLIIMIMNACMHDNELFLCVAIFSSRVVGEGGCGIGWGRGRC